MEKVNVSDLSKADILLNHYVDTHDESYYQAKAFELAYDVINYYLWGTIIDPNKYIDFRHKLITLFDEDIYYHAGFFSGPNIIEEVIRSDFNGISETNTDAYKAYPTHVFRYVDGNGAILNPNGSGAAKLDDLAKHYLNAPENAYSFWNAGVLMALSALKIVGHRKGADAIRYLLAKIDSVLGTNLSYYLANEAVLNFLYGKYLDLIRSTLGGHWDRQVMVCSQFVARVYNEADDGAYELKRAQPHLAAQTLQSPEGTGSQSPTGSGDEKLSAACDELRQKIEDKALISTATAGDSATDELITKLIDDMYTPADIAHSPNVVRVGELVFDD